MDGDDQERRDNDRDPVGGADVVSVGRVRRPRAEHARGGGRGDERQRACGERLAESTETADGLPGRQGASILIAVNDAEPPISPRLGQPPQVRTARRPVYARSRRLARRAQHAALRPGLARPWSPVGGAAGSRVRRHALARRRLRSPGGGARDRGGPSRSRSPHQGPRRGAVRAPDVGVHGDPRAALRRSGAASAPPAGPLSDPRGPRARAPASCPTSAFSAPSRAPAR